MATWRILTIDGGGIRGIIPAHWLDMVQKELGTPLWQSFDLICGTSTGAIVAAAAATGMDMGSVVKLFRNEGPKIFRKGLFYRSPFRDRYNGKYLDTVLENELGNMQMEDAKTNLCITTYDIENRKAVLLRSYDNFTKDIELWKACRASSSAPTYFPPFKTRIGVASRILIDGGVCANNPSSLALAESISIANKKSLKLMNDEIVMISLGTGSSTRNLCEDRKPPLGLAGWARPVLDVLFDGSAGMSDYIVGQILAPEKYIRLQFDLNSGQGSDDLDDAGINNIEALHGAAEAHVTVGSGKPIFEKLLRTLNSFKHDSLKVVENPRDDLPAPQ